MRIHAKLHDARFEQSDPRRHVEPHDPEPFDRIDFAMRALEVLRPKRMRIAVYQAVSTMQIESVKDLSRKDFHIASVGIPPHASREHIAYALAELAGVASVPYVVQTLINLDRRPGG